MKHHIDYIVENMNRYYVYGHTYEPQDSVLLASWVGMIDNGEITLQWYRGSISNAFALEYLFQRRMAIEMGSYQHKTFHTTFSLKD